MTAEQNVTSTGAAADHETRGLLRDSVNETLRRLGGIKLARALQNGDESSSRELRRTVTASGWNATLVPAARGGAGLGVAEACIIAEEFGRVALPFPLIACDLLPSLVLSAASDGAGVPAKQPLGRLLEGSARYALAWQESDRAAADSMGETRADDKSRTITGRKLFVVGGDAADSLIVAARQGDGCGLYLVDAKRAGVSIRTDRAVDGTRYATVELRDAAVVQIVARDGQARALLAAAVELGQVAAGAELFGGMCAALELTLGYMRTRVQFGRAIGAFQALQHRAADLFVQKELSRAVLDEAIVAMDTGGSGGQRHSAVHRAKARCSDAALRVAKDAVQLHGAIGYTDEYDLSLYLKRAMVLASWLGNGTAHRREYFRVAYAQ